MQSTGNKLAGIFVLITAVAIGCRVLQPDENLSCRQRSILAEASGDSLLSEGLEEQARDAYVRAALLRIPEDTLRADLVWKAAGCSDSHSVITAQLLLEYQDSIAPYRAIELGGAVIGRELLSRLSRNDCVMPEYLRLVLADSLID
ncbi:MAG: hypothetical protein ABFR50_09810, partial [Candidatus Fermentibacteria bacterium]